MPKITEKFLYKINPRRYGFAYEGVHRNYAVMKGRNRDTAWLSITAEEWPEICQVHDEWLELAVNGKHQSLAEMTKQVRKKHYENFLKQF